MARSVNRATLVGNLGQDPELRTTPQGKSVCTLRMATSDSYKDATGNWQETTEWHTIVCWEGLANQAAETLRKGSKVYVEGKIKHRTYEGKDGVTRNVTEILANTVISLGNRESSGSSPSNSGDRYYSEPSNYGTPDLDVSLSDEVPF